MNTGSEPLCLKDWEPARLDLREEGRGLDPQCLMEEGYSPDAWN